MSEDREAREPQKLEGEETAGPSTSDGTPDEGAEMDEGLTPEERKMLSSLSVGEGAAESRVEAEPVSEAPPAEAAAPVEESAAEVETPGKEEIAPAEEKPEAVQVEAPAPALEAAEGEPTGAVPVVEEKPGGPGPPPGDAPLSDEEEQVLSQVRDESQRVSREELPTMFEGKEPVPGAPEAAPLQAVEPGPPAGKTEAPAAPGAPAGEDAPAEAPEPTAEVVGDETPAAAAPTVEQTGVLRLLAVSLDLINRPFRGVPPVWRMGLGLCGVLLLITLFLVILVRILLGP